MQAIILVHGIMGSKLQLGTEEIWPPSFGEVLSGHLLESQACNSLNVGLEGSKEA